MKDTNRMETFSEIPDNPSVDRPVDAPAAWKRFAPESIANIQADQVMWSEVVPGGAHWSFIMPRGSALRFVALDAGANASVVLYAAHEKLERYNMPDSLKAQHTAHYARGHVLMSDMGRSLASITSDTVGWHDPLGALLDAELLKQKYGTRAFEQYRNAMYRNGKDGLLIEIGKYGLNKRDLIAPVNLFSKLSVDEEGRFRFAENHSKADDHVELRFDMDVLLAYSTAPHALDPNPEYAPKKVGLVAWRCGLAAADDYCRRFRPENARAIHNSDMLYL